MNNSITFPFISSFVDIIDPKIFEIIIHGFCDEINQAIIFVSALDQEYFIPRDKELVEYSCDSCQNFIMNESCTPVRIAELISYKNQKEKITLYFCPNGSGGIHLEYPLFVDGLFCGLLISGSIKFSEKPNPDEITNLISAINNDFKTNINTLFQNYDFKWYDRLHLQGIEITPQELDSKRGIFEQYASRIEVLLNQVYVGKIRENNRNSIREIFDVFSKRNIEISMEYGEEAYRKNFKEILLILKKIIPVDNLILYDNFISDKGEKIYSANVFIDNPSPAQEELTLLPNIFDNYFENGYIFFWETKNDFLKYKYDEIEKINRKKIFSYFCEELDICPSFLVLLPINIHHSPDKNRRLLLLFYCIKPFHYGSENLIHYFRRLFDIFGFIVRNYYDQIRKERYLMRISHDSKGKAGIIYTIAEDTIRQINTLEKFEIKMKFEDVKKTSDNLANLANGIDKLARSDYDSFSITTFSKINFYKDIYLSLFHSYKNMINQKGLIFDHDKLENLPSLQVNFHFLYRIFENLFTNIIKYSINNSIVSLKYTELPHPKKVIKIILSNLTVKLNQDELKKIVSEKYRGSNIIELKKTYTNINLPKGRGLGIKIIQELLACMNCRMKIYQNAISNDDISSIQNSPDFFIYERNFFSRFITEIIINNLE